MAKVLVYKHGTEDIFSVLLPPYPFDFMEEFPS